MFFHHFLKPQTILLDMNSKRNKSCFQKQFITYLGLCYYDTSQIQHQIDLTEKSWHIASQANFPMLLFTKLHTFLGQVAFQMETLNNNSIRFPCPILFSHWKSRIFYFFQVTFQTMWFPIQNDVHEVFATTPIYIVDSLLHKLEGLSHY